MKANELRIGNWVYEYDALGGLFYNQVGWGIIGDLVDGLSPCEPIPITPEILEKAGFSNETYYYEKDEICIRIYDGKFYALAMWVPLESETNTLIESVHQLQNLYFALTGIELDINL